MSDPKHPNSSENDHHESAAVLWFEHACTAVGSGEYACALDFLDQAVSTLVRKKEFDVRVGLWVRSIWELIKKHAHTGGSSAPAKRVRAETERFDALIAEAVLSLENRKDFSGQDVLAVVHETLDYLQSELTTP